MEIEYEIKATTVTHRSNEVKYVIDGSGFCYSLHQLTPKAFAQRVREKGERRYTRKWLGHFESFEAAQAAVVLLKG